MSISGSELLASLNDYLLDPDGNVWSSDLKVGFVNEALTLLARLRPDAVATETDFTLVANIPRQVIPDDGFRFLDIPLNVGGGAVREIEKRVLNSTIPAWATPDDITEIEYFAFDPKAPRYFYVYPVPDSAIDVELIYARTVPTFTADATDLGIDDSFLSPLKEFVYNRCFGMNSKRMDLTRASAHLTAGYTALGINLSSDDEETE